MSRAVVRMSPKHTDNKDQKAPKRQHIEKIKRSQIVQAPLFVNNGNMFGDVIVQNGPQDMQIQIESKKKRKLKHQRFEPSSPYPERM